MTVETAPNASAAADPHGGGAAEAGQGAGPRGGSLSTILASIANDPSRERVSIADLLDVMRERALAALLVIFALPNVLPTPPGTSSILGAPLIILTVQLALGRPPWLPRVIASRSMARADFAAMINRAVPWLAKAERLLRPRLRAFAYPPAERIAGVVCFCLAVILFLPIPLGNMLPALSICLFALGILERDGLWVIAGFVMSAVSIVVVWGVLWALIKAGLFIITNAFA